MSENIKYEIVRSVSKTVQEKQFEPKSDFSSHKMGFSEIPSDREIEDYSKLLQLRAENDVLKAINEVIESLNPEEEYGRVTKETKPKPQPWVCANGHSVSAGLDRCPHPDHYPVYTATDKNGGKELVDKEANTGKPF